MFGKCSKNFGEERAVRRVEIMSLYRSWRASAIVGIVLMAMAGTAWAQTPEQQPLALTGRVLFGAGDYSANNVSEVGPAGAAGGDLSGYWRNPGIFGFELQPMVAISNGVSGTPLGNEMTSVFATGLILQGSQLPLNISYSRTSSALEQSANGTAPQGQGVLSGVATNPTSSVFNVNWLLRFTHFPVVNLTYRGSDINSPLPADFGGNDDSTLHTFNAQANYTYRGWGIGSWYQRALAKTTSPDILTGSMQSEDDETADFGVTVSKLLPLQSTLGVEADRSQANSTFDGSQTNTSVDMANASLTSHPLEKLSTTLQAQYTSNLQVSEIQQALSGAGVSGTTSSGGSSSSSVPISYLATPFSELTINASAGYELPHGLTITGMAGESHSPNSGSSTQWSVSPGYHRKWRTGWLSANYSYNSMTSQLNVLSENPTTGAASTSEGTTAYTLFSETMYANMGTVSVTERLPDQFKLVTSAHASKGTITEDGIPYPDHDYGGFATVSRPVGEWKLTGSFILDRNTADQQLIYNQTSSESYSLSAAFRRLSLSAGRAYGSGLALQVGNNLVWVTSPVVVSSLLGTPVLSNSTGTTVSASYQSQRSRLSMYGNWGRFNYTTNNQLASAYTVLNLYATYKLRRLRLIAGYTKQSQTFGTGSSGAYDTTMMYFQVERAFRVF